MIARGGVLLLEGSLVLLVYNHQAQPLKGEENRAAGTQNDIIRTGGELLAPYLHPFLVTILGMVNAQTVTENPMEPLHDLHRERYLRQKIKHLLPPFNSLADKVNIDLCLAAGGDAMEQNDILVLHLAQNAVVGFPLWRSERLDKLRMISAPMVETPHFFLVGAQQFPVEQGFQGGGGASALVEQFLTGHLDKGLPQVVTLYGIPMGEREKDRKKA